MKKGWPDFIRDGSGTTAVLFALAALPLLGILAVAVDFSRAYRVKAELQTAADSAAVGSATAGDLAMAQREALAHRLFKANAILAPDLTPTVTIEGDVVRVDARYEVGTTLAKLMGFSTIPVHVASAAQAKSAGRGTGQCILLLEPTNPGLYVNSGSNLDADCGVQVNSRHEKALEINSDSRVVASWINVSGGAFINSASTVNPKPETAAPAQPDPLADMPEPPQGNWGCDYNDFTVSSGRSVSMLPGVYCGKTLVQNFADVTMQPGIYTFKNGPFEVNSFGRVVGNGVMLYFANKDAYLKVNSDSSVRLSALVSGDYQGILLFSSRKTEMLDANPHIVNSDSSSMLEGTIYTPNSALEVNSRSAANQDARYTAIVARRMVLNSIGTFQIRSDYGSGAPFPPGVNEFKPRTFAVLVD